MLQAVVLFHNQLSQKMSKLIVKSSTVDRTKEELNAIGYKLDFDDGLGAFYVLPEERRILTAVLNLVELISILKEAKFITKLSFASFDQPLDYSCFKILADGLKHTNINILNLEWTSMSDKALDYLSQNLPETNIRHLYLGTNHITDKGLKILADNLSKIEVLYLGYNNITDEGLKILAPKLKSSAITSLDLTECKITDKGIGFLVQYLPVNNNMILNFGKNHITDKGLTHLAGYLSKIKIDTLYFDDTDITDKGVKTLAHHLKSSSLVTLSLNRNKITTKSVEALAEALPFTSITDMSISGAKITTKAIKALAQTLPFTNLISIDLTDVNITKKGFKILNSILPFTNIVMVDLSMMDEGISEEISEDCEEFLTSLDIHKEYLAKKVEQFMDKSHTSDIEQLAFYSKVNEVSLSEYLEELGLNKKYNPASLFEKAKNILSLTTKELAEKLSQGPASIVIEYLVNPHLISHSNSFSPETKFDTKSLYYEVAPTSATSSSATVTLTGQIVAGSEVVSSEDTSAEAMDTTSSCIIL